MANAALNGTDLPSNVNEFLRNVEVDLVEPPDDSASGTQEQAGKASVFVRKVQEL